MTVRSYAPFSGPGSARRRCTSAHHGLGWVRRLDRAGRQPAVGCSAHGCSAHGCSAVAGPACADCFRSLSFPSPRLVAVDPRRGPRARASAGARAVQAPAVQAPVGQAPVGQALALRALASAGLCIGWPCIGGPYGASPSNASPALAGPGPQLGLASAWPGLSLALPQLGVASAWRCLGLTWPWLGVALALPQLGGALACCCRGSLAACPVRVGVTALAHCWLIWRRRRPDPACVGALALASVGLASGVAVGEGVLGTARVCSALSCQPDSPNE
jgi:hypothetical protein